MDSAGAIRGRESNYRQDAWDDDEKGSRNQEWLAKKLSPSDSSDSSSSPISQQPTMAPSSSPTKRPTSYPRPLFTSQMSAEEKAACKAAANGEVYTTKNSVVVRYIYELLFPVDRIATDVASKVDEKIQAFLVDELLDCEGPNPLSTVAGVGPGQDIDAIIKESCSNLIPEEYQACHLMAGSVTLYLPKTKAESNSDEEPYDPVLEKLRLAFHGARRKLQDRFVDEELGILRLYYVGDYVYKDHTDKKRPGEVYTPSISSNVPDSKQPTKSASTTLISVVIARLQVSWCLYSLLSF